MGYADRNGNQEPAEIRDELRAINVAGVPGSVGNARRRQSAIFFYSRDTAGRRRRLDAALESLVPSDAEAHVQISEMRNEVVACAESRTVARLRESQVQRHDAARRPRGRGDVPWKGNCQLMCSNLPQLSESGTLQNVHRDLEMVAVVRIIPLTTHAKAWEKQIHGLFW